MHRENKVFHISTSENPITCSDLMLPGTELLLYKIQVRFKNKTIYKVLSGICTLHIEIHGP